MPNTRGRVQRRQRKRPTTTLAVVLALIAALTRTTLAQKSLQTTATTPPPPLPPPPLPPTTTTTKSGSTAAAAAASSSISSLSQSNINYFALNEANAPLAVLDLLEATMQIYHDYNHHNGGGGGGAGNDTNGFTTGVLLVTISEGDFDAFPPNRLRPAYSMQGSSRQLRVPDVVYKRAVRLLRDADELTIAAVVRQERANTGSIVSFSLDSNRYFELESSGRKDEVRLHYVSPGSRRVHTEVFAYGLADGHWHAVAVTLSGSQARLFVDCRLVYTRTLAAGPADTSFAGSPDLYVGQRNKGVHSVFKGLLQDVRLIRGADGQRVQCPAVDTSCPTCGQFIAMQKTMENLNTIVNLLINKLEAAETRIAELETCECRKPCVQFDERNNNTVMKADGSVWQRECETCACMRGRVECSPVRCPPVNCTFPVRKPGECCQTCQKPCRTKGDILFQHGDTVNLEPCLSCICLNGLVKCDKIDSKTQCPPLECDESEQFSVPDQCCKFCPGVDYCARGGRDLCHPNATCINLKTTHKCACTNGYFGDGLKCDDVDECASVGGQNGHHCDANTTVCVNTPGSYACRCNAGYARLNSFECADVDECSVQDESLSPCHLHATCTNSPGSFSCKCEDGYVGDGYTCRPACQQKCLNGGVCARPNECSCPNAFEGPACELDVDECATGAHGCLGPSSRCVNMAGWYYCACSPGYQNVIMYHDASADVATTAAAAVGDPNVLEPTWSPVLGTTCQDIDECATNNHTCHPSATCVNTVGSYECRCSPTVNNGNRTDNGSTECKSSCLHKGADNAVTEVEDGAWLAPEECTNCTCAGGRLHCARVRCDCADGDHARSVCCAHCDAQASCAHQELANVRFRSGQQWIYECQTCECLLGQIDCWRIQCPPITMATGTAGCADSAATTSFADCCASRCDPNGGTSPSATPTANAVAVTDPCLQQHVDGRRDNGGDRDGDKDDDGNNNGKPCFNEGHVYQSGAQWDDPVDMCTSCDCKVPPYCAQPDGVLCCSYDVRRCNNGSYGDGTVAGDGDATVGRDLSADRSDRENGDRQIVRTGGAEHPVVKRSVRGRRQVAVVGGRGGGDGDDNSLDEKEDWWWRKTRRRKRRRQSGDDYVQAVSNSSSVIGGDGASNDNDRNDDNGSGGSLVDLG